MKSPTDPAAAHWLWDCLQAVKFQDKYPLYAYVLARLDVNLSARVPAMAVSPHGPQIRLHINRAYFEQHPEYFEGVLLHEIHHVVLGHISHFRFQGAVFPDLMTLAKEMSANEYIVAPLPDGVFWQAYAAYGIGPDQSTLYRYERLAAARRDGQLQHQSLCGVYVPCDEHADGKEIGDSLSAAAVENILHDLAAHEAETIGDEMEDSNGGPTIAGQQVANLILALRATGQAAVRPLNWRTALRQFVGTTHPRAATYKRPNRRFPERVGQIPGHARGRAPHGRPRLLVALDTSQSMEASDLALLAEEIDKLAGLATITIVECDERIQRVYQYVLRIASVSGRGGTSFRPVFEPDFLEAHRPNGVIYMTDGDGPWPARDPGVRTLWVLTGDPARFGCPWGKRVGLRVGP